MPFTRQRSAGRRARSADASRSIAVGALAEGAQVIVGVDSGIVAILPDGLKGVPADLAEVDQGSLLRGQALHELELTRRTHLALT